MTRLGEPAALQPESGLAAVLDALAAGTRVSGSVLAGRLGVSRAAVWKHVQRLRALGLAIEAGAGRGYRLAAPFERLDAALIRAALADAWLPASVEVHWHLDSTSSELLRRAPRAGTERIACLAELQGSGRGRRGRAWHTPLGGGLALSLLQRFDCGMAALAGLSLVAGVAAAEALADCGIGDIGLKWPNDLVANGAKLGGILVELGGDALGPCHAVIGIGLNHRLDAPTRAAIGQPATDLAALANGEPPSRNRVAARVLARLGAALDLFAARGFGAFADAWAARDVLRGQRVCVLGRDAREGVALGVDARGALRVRLAGGECAVDSGEVSVRGPA